MAVHDIDGSVELVSKHLPLPCRRWPYLAGDIDDPVELVSKHLPLPCRRWQYLAGDIDGSVELVFADIRAAEHDSLTVSYRHLTADPPDKWGGGGIRCTHGN